MTKRHEKYWQDRIDEIYRYVDREDINMFKRLTDLYNRNVLSLQNEVFKFYAKFAEDEGITLEEAKQRLRGEDFSDYQANARKYFEESEDNPELLKRLNEQYRASKVTRHEALLFETEYQLGILNGSLQGTFEQYLMGIASYSYKKIIGGRSASTLNRPAMEEIVNRPWNGHNYSEDLWGNTDNLVRKLRKTFEKGFSRGLGVREMAQEIRKDFRVANSRAETLIRTDGSHVINNATLKRYEDAGLKYVRIYVKLDDRTTDICRTFHEEDKRYLISDPDRPILPAHYNCRSGWVVDLEEINQ